MNLKKEVAYLIEQLREFYYWNQISSIPCSIQHLITLCLSSHFESSTRPGYCPKATWTYIKLHRDGTLTLHTYEVSNLYFYVSDTSQEKPTFKLDSMESTNLGLIEEDGCEKELIEHLKEKSYETLTDFWKLNQWIHDPNFVISEAKQCELKELLVFAEDVVPWIQTTSLIQPHEKTYLSSFYISLTPFFSLDNDISCLFECTDLTWHKKASEFYRHMRLQIPTDYNVAVGVTTRENGVILCQGGRQTKWID